MHFVTFNYYSISLLIGAFTAIISGFIVFLNNRGKPENQAWFAMTISTAVWSSAYFVMTVADNRALAAIGNLVLHYAAIFIPLFYLLLVFIITKTFMKNMWSFVVATVMALAFVLINPLPAFVSDVVPKVGFNFAPVPGPLYFYFFVYFFALVTYGIIVCLYKMRVTEEKKERMRYLYTVLFTLAASIGGGSVFMTTFFPAIPPYPLILFSLYPLISGYGILKHQLFNVKIITTQFITFGLWIIILIRAFLSETSKDFVLNMGLLAISIVFGLFLIKSVKKEVENREKIERLANDLSLANDRLQDLDKQKNEFVSMASHQLRGPLTAVKGYASMILEGDFGELVPSVKDAVEKIYKSTQDLVVVVGDYLDVSRIEQGRMQYDFSNFDLKELVETVVNELRPNVEKANLSVKFDSTPGVLYMINADKGKIKQVIGNLLDNSIKYTPKGGIHVWLSLKKDPADGTGTGRKALISISDTGVGIHPDVMPKLFAKFSRAPNASETNILGTGLGLYVAKKMIEAHDGRVWAESAGTGKGSTFFIELDLADPKEEGNEDKDIVPNKLRPHISEANPAPAASEITKTMTPAAPIDASVAQSTLPPQNPNVQPASASVQA